MPEAAAAEAGGQTSTQNTNNRFWNDAVVIYAHFEPQQL